MTDSQERFKLKNNTERLKMSEEALERVKHSPLQKFQDTLEEAQTKEDQVLKTFPL